MIANSISNKCRILSLRAVACLAGNGCHHALGKDTDSWTDIVIDTDSLDTDSPFHTGSDSITSVTSEVPLTYRPKATSCLNVHSPNEMIICGSASHSLTVA
ncbi:MAG: hypothetical protein JXR76_17300 [Deltaproteobacteria bacterium]|nr:hypothetical protein [Deltaproteobacteria bacterium]